MYDCAIRPNLSQRGAYQVGTRILHRYHILACDRSDWDAIQLSIHFLHQ